jgi:hypothetical protein
MKSGVHPHSPSVYEELSRQQCSNAFHELFLALDGQAVVGVRERVCDGGVQWRAIGA